ncbi:MAG TPA: cbb3-type cytochrome c oxidase subunit I [Ktedonobacterales bacterium]
MSATTASADAPKSMGQKLLPSFVTGFILAAIGYFVGTWYVYTFIGTGHDEAGPNFTEQGILFGLFLAVVGWMIGIGALNEPIRWLLALRDPTHEDDLKLAGKGGGVWRYFRFTTDHKVVGVQYFVYVMIMLAFGGLGAMLIRSELMFPGARLFPPNAYNTIVTMHGMLMILTTITFFTGPFGNFIVPIMIGARDMAFPRLNALSFAFIVPAVPIFLSSPFFGQGQTNGTGAGIQTGWTLYGPIADQTGVGMTVLAFAVILAATSSTLGAVNIITTIVTMRAPGMKWTRLPLFVWGIFGTAIMAALGTGAFMVDLVLLEMDRVFGTSFFFAAVGGNTVGTGGGSAWLYQNLFWFFGHPEVYIIVMPAFGLVMDLIAVFSRKPIFGYKFGVLGIMGVVVLSFMVWAHHEFVSGWAPELRPAYMATTEMISVPTGLVFLVGLATLWRGKIWTNVTMLFALAFLWNFAIGGLTGVFLSDVPADVQLHGGMFVTAHFHFTIVGGALFGFFAAVYYFFPKITGRMMDEGLGKIHFWGTMIGFNVAFLAMLYAGLQGMPRRVADYDPVFWPANFITSIFAFILAASILVFFWNVAHSWVAGEQAVANPWGADTLEWQVPTPVPLENFETIPVVTKPPHDYGEEERAPAGAPVPGLGGQVAG